MGSGILLGLSFELTLMKEERRRKKKGSRVRGEIVLGGSRAATRKKRGGVSHEMSKMPFPLSFFFGVSS